MKQIWLRGSQTGGLEEAGVEKGLPDRGREFAETGQAVVQMRHGQ